MKRLPPATVWLPVALLIAYPLLSHTATMLAAPLLQWLALLAVIAIPVSAALLRGRPLFWLGFVLAAGLLWWLVHAGGGQYALYLPPLLLPGALAASFALSLRPGRTPLITAIADAARGPLTPRIARYTRRLTLFWALLTASLLAIALLLSCTGPLWLWSLFTNFITYAVLGAVFAVEYLLRRRWYPEHDHPGFLDYLAIVVKGPPRRSASP